MALRPFRIEFTHRAQDDLRQRIDRTRWPSPLDGEAAFDGALRLLARDWARLDWPDWQERLNGLSHLRGVVGGGEVHAAVMAGPWGERRQPLLLLHDAPGAFFDRLPLARRLAHPSDDGAAFDVVLASLPGTGYSERLEGDPTPEASAVRLHALMVALGYGGYLVHGDGYGALVAAALPAVSGGAARDLGVGVSPQRPGLPAALAYALGDSPVGMLSWWLAGRGGHEALAALSPEEREAWLASATWCWLTGSAVAAAGWPAAGSAPASDDAIMAAARGAGG